MSAILKKEIKTYFTSLTTYLYFAIFFLATDIYFCVYCLSNYNSQFGYYVLAKTFYICILIIPFFTMKLFALEKRRKTDQLLYTSPVTGLEIMLGKCFAVLIVLFLPVIVSLIYPVVLSFHDDLSVRFVACAYIGVCLLLLATVAIGTFFSTVTGNIYLAAVFTYGSFMLFVLLRVVERIAGDGALYHFLKTVSPYNIYNDMISGIVKRGDVIYLILISALFFALAYFNISKGKLKNKGYCVRVLIVAAAFVILSSLAFMNSRVYDFTPEKILTLSDTTDEILADIDKPTDIYYMGSISNANATYTEFLKLYEAANDNIKVHYKEIDNDIDFQVKYMRNISMINEASMLVVCGDSFIYLDSQDYIKTIQVSDYSYKSILDMEGMLTTAIYHVNSDDKYRIYCSGGHGEAEITGKCENYLTLSGYTLKDINIYERINTIEDVIPDDCCVFVINGPQTDFSKEEIDVLDSYIENGGKIAVFLDPLNEDTNNLYGFLEKYDMKIMSGVVIEKDPTRYAYDTEYCLAPRLKEHDITNELIKQGLYVYSMTSKGIMADDTDENRTDLMTTSAKAFSKISDFDNITSKNEGDIGGPFSIASLYEKKDGKLFVITSNMFLQDDTDKDTLGGNHKFLTNVLDYMSGREDSFSIEGKDVSFKTAMYPNSKIKTIRILLIVVVPLFIIVTGIIVILLRAGNVVVSYRKKKEQEIIDENDKQAEKEEQE